jgi:hypothetical protein
VRRKQIIVWLSAGLSLTLLLMSWTQGLALTDVSVSVTAGATRATCAASYLLLNLTTRGEPGDSYGGMTITDANGVAVSAISGPVTQGLATAFPPPVIFLNAINPITARPLIITVYDMDSTFPNGDPALLYTQLQTGSFPVVDTFIIDPADTLPDCASLEYINATNTPTATATFTATPTLTRTPTITPTFFLNATPELNMFPSLDVTLTWNRLTWAAQYEVQIDNAVDFLTPIHTSPPQSALSYTYTAPADGRYYWRVRGRDANNAFGAWSVTGSFVVDATP